MGHDNIGVTTGVAAGWRGDWPARGSEVVGDDHTPPHSGCGTEYWYFHCQLGTASGEEHSVFCVFSRHEAGGPTDQRLVMHALRWARVDHVDGFCISQSWLDSVDLLHRATAADQVMDPYFRSALVETLAQGEPVAPDRLLPGPVLSRAGTLDLDYGGVGTLRALPNGAYQVSVTAEYEQFRLIFTPRKPAIVRGQDGVIPGRFPDGGDAQFGYLVPRLAVEGTLTPVGGTQTPVTGTGWHEHVFGGDGYRLTPHRAADRAGESVRIQLDNGWDLALLHLRHASGRSDTEDAAGPAEHHAAVACSPDGARVPCTASITTTQPWQSVRTLHTYPTEWDITVDELDLHLIIQVRPPLTEIESVALGVRGLGPRLLTKGVLRGHPVQGQAWVELAPADRVDDLESLPRRFGPIVHEQITTHYPDTLTEDALAGIVDADRSILEAISPEEIQHSLIAPVRHLADGGGKQWRAYVIYIMAKLYGAPLERMLPMLGVAETIHSAMLAIDDIEDGSLQRRGRPAAHVMYGTPQTINAAYALLFMDHIVNPRLLDEGVSVEMRLKSYQDYMQTIRLLHIGQALDIHGHTEAMDTAVATGNPDPLLAKLRAVYRLKTSVVFSHMANEPLWTLVEPDVLLDKAGHYWDAVGLAFQITDDVLDLHGLNGTDSNGQLRQLRRAGEDLRAGKVTMPLAHAVRLLPHHEMMTLWKSVRDGAADDATVHRIAQTLIDCGSVEACYTEARTLVNNAWQLMKPAPSSYAKLICRAIGLYMANRQHGDLS